jgi:hypothetical protein
MNRRNFITRSDALLAFAGTVPTAIAQSTPEKTNVPRTSIHRI